MTLNIRSANKDDARTIADFNLAMAAETESRELCPETVAKGVRAVFDRPELGQYLVAEQDGRVVGQLMITYEWSDWRNGMFWWIQSVYVHPDQRRNGVFRELYRHVEKLARSSPGVCGIRLYVEQHNERAIKTYRELGMIPSGHTVFEVDWAIGSMNPE